MYAYVGSTSGGGVTFMRSYPGTNLWGTRLTDCRSSRSYRPTKTHTI